MSNQKYVEKVYNTSVILTMSMNASSGSGQDICSHMSHTGWMQATKSTAEELCFMGAALECMACSWEPYLKKHHNAET